MFLANKSTPGAKRKLSRAILVGSAVLVLAGYVFREPILRGFVAIKISNARLFTPAAAAPDESGWRRRIDATQFYWDLAGLELDRRKRVKELNPLLQPLLKELRRHQSAGEGMQYSMHIYREIRWRLNFTHDVEATRSRIRDLQESLSQPAQQKLATQQQASDGSWGLGFTVWYLKLYYTVEDGLGTLDGPPQYPLTFLDRINTPDSLRAQLDSLLQNDFTKTGTFNREELDETFSATARLLFKDNRSNYPFHPQLKDALRQFVNDWQNPRTGCWGQWLIDRHGRIWKMDDMAMTFHVVSDFHGQVSHLDQIARRVVELDGVNFPGGIRVNGHYEDHLNWDVVKILKYAWPTLDEKSRAAAREELTRLLHWCLTESLQSDGSFKTSDLDDTLGDAFSYGVSFLHDVGYFRRSECFWADKDFPEAEAVRNRILARLRSIGLNDPGLKDAYETLGELK
jgi:hypothetical protein